MFILRACFAVAVLAANALATEPIDIGSHRQLFVDHYLIDKLDGTELRLQRPRDEGPVFKMDLPWEGKFCAYFSVLHPADGKYQMYYRGAGFGAKASDKDSVTCYAESSDGQTWIKPSLDLFPATDGTKTNVVIAHMGMIAHNFSPFIDGNPACKPDEKYKAMGGYDDVGMFALASPDGIHWKKLQDSAVLTREQAWGSFAFDSQNVPFWSELEKKYVLFYRVYANHNRRIARMDSDDLIHWQNKKLMEYRAADGGPAPVEQLYTNQTQPYFRAPELYVSTAARFMQHRQVLTTQQAEAVNVDPKYFNDTSDAIFMTNRNGDDHYDRTFMSGLVWPAIGYSNWTSRTNYPSLGIVQTGPTEMSFFVNQNYAQPTANLHRYSFRLDGFAAVHANYENGEMITKPIKFDGSELKLNFASSAAGGIKVELQDEQGQPIPGFEASACQELIGNELDRTVRWSGGEITKLPGKTVRMHFIMHDADLFAFQFKPVTTAVSQAENPR